MRHATEGDAERERAAQSDAEEILERGAKWLGQKGVHRHVVVNASTGEGLRQLAEEHDADVIVFGSDLHIILGHVQPGRRPSG